MSNLKRRYLEVTLAVVILLILTLSGGRVFGIMPPDIRPIRPKPLRDYLVQPPNSAYSTWGYREDTFLLYNIVANKEKAERNEVLIAALRAEIDELKKLVALQEKIVDALSEAVLTNTRSLHAAKVPFIEKFPIVPVDPNEDHSITIVAPITKEEFRKIMKEKAK